MPRLSICIATRNRASFIGCTLDNILLQATEEVEIVVVDGASTDNTDRILQERQARGTQLRYFRLPANGGFDEDYDRAVELAHGDYCWLMADDDLLKPGAIATVLHAISENPDLVVLNYEVWNKDFTQRLLSEVLSMRADRLYSPSDSQSLFIDTAEALSFIGSVVIKTRLWLGRNRVSYFGTLFLPVGVIFQAPLTNTALVIARPQVATRYGNAAWWNRHFEIWMLIWPSLIWSFSGFTSASKRQICPHEPWRNLEILLRNRAIDVFSNREYSRWLRPRLTSRRERWITHMVARSPGCVWNLLYVAFISLFHLNVDRGFFLVDLKASRYYYRTCLRQLFGKGSLATVSSNGTSQQQKSD